MARKPVQQQQRQQQWWQLDARSVMCTCRSRLHRLLLLLALAAGWWQGASAFAYTSTSTVNITWPSSYVTCDYYTLSYQVCMMHHRRVGAGFHAEGQAAGVGGMKEFDSHTGDGMPKGERAVVKSVVQAAHSLCFSENSRGGT